MVQQNTGSIGDRVFGFGIEIVLVLGGCDRIVLLIYGHNDADLFGSESLERGRVTLNGIIVDVSGLDFHGLFEMEKFDCNIRVILEPFSVESHFGLSGQGTEVGFYAENCVRGSCDSRDIECPHVAEPIIGPPAVDYNSLFIGIIEHSRGFSLFWLHNLFCLLVGDQINGFPFGGVHVQIIGVFHES